MYRAAEVKQVLDNRVHNGQGDRLRNRHEAVILAPHTLYESVYPLHIRPLRVFETQRRDTGKGADVRAFRDRHDDLIEYLICVHGVHLHPKKIAVQGLAQNVGIFMGTDIRLDIEVCKIENWDYKEYLLELKKLIDSFF